MKKTYCQTWSEHYNKPLNLFSDDEAEKAHNTRKQYTVVFGDLSDPHCYITINDDYLGVKFLDSSHRTYLRFQFIEVDEGVLFLESVAYWEFEGENQDVSLAEFYDFTPDGELRIEVVDRKADTVDVAEDEGVDVSCNYEDYPEFGEYDALIDRERPMPR